MFREMRRKRQSLSREKCIEILGQCTSGVLALTGDDGYPYAVPLSYVCDEESIIFHSAQAGHKIDAIQRNEKASFCVIAKDFVMPEEYTTYYRSVIVFGRIHILTDDIEKRDAIGKLAKRYAPTDSAESRQAAIEREWNRLCMLKMTMEHLSGKEAVELVRIREKNK